MEARLDREWLWRQPEFQALATNLAHQFLLFCATGTQADRRRIYKVEYEVEVIRPSTSWWRRRERLRRARFTTLLPQVSMCSSYHVEMRLPQELVFDSADIVRETTSATPVAVRQIQVRAHDVAVHLTSMEEGAIVLRARIGPEPHGMLASAYYIAWSMTAISLGALTLHLWLHIKPDPGLGTAVLVVLPGLFAAFLVAQGDQPLVAIFSRRLRRLIFGAAALSFVEASSLAISGLALPSWFPEADRFGWRTVVWLLCGVTFGAIGAYLWQERRQVRQPRIGE